MSRTCSAPFLILRHYESTALRRCPFLHTRPLLHNDPKQRRPAFSTSARVQAVGALNYKVERAKKEALRTAQLPEDVGLLPQTLIMPSSKKRPSWVSRPRDRLRLEKNRLKLRAMESIMIFWYRFGWHMKPRPRLHLRQIPGIAQTMHKRMYEEFAKGNLDAIQPTTMDGFMGKLRARIGQRRAGTLLRWTLHEYKSRSKLVSYKPAFLPGPKGESNRERKGVLQAVVRIHSVQSLQRIRREAVRGRSGEIREFLVDEVGREVPDTEESIRQHAKELVEYVVLQKTIRNSKEGPWKLWGTTEETSDILEGKRNSEADPAITA